MLDEQEVNDFFANRSNLLTTERLSKETKFTADSNNPTGFIMDEYSKSDITNFLKKLIKSFIKKDTGRVSNVLFASDSNGNSDGKGGIIGFNSLKTTLGQNGSNFLWDEVKNFFHEATHLSNGLFGYLIEKDNNLNFIHINGYRSDKVADQLVEWLTIFAENPDFFNKYFFNMEGDSTLNQIRSGKMLQRGLNEIMAISCTNYFFGERANWMGEMIKEYPDIERAIRRQLAITFYGGEALEKFPDGIDDGNLASIRQEFGRNYILGLVELMGSDVDDLGSTIMKVITGDLRKYYTENTAGYLVADGEPGNETNRRFIEENDLEKHISARPANIRGYQYMNQINEFIVRYGSVFFPNGKINDLS